MQMIIGALLGGMIGMFFGMVLFAIGFRSNEDESYKRGFDDGCRECLKTREEKESNNG